MSAYPGTVAATAGVGLYQRNLFGACFLRPKVSSGATANSHKPAKPDCASAVGETAIGAVTSGAAVALVVYVGPELVAAAGIEATGAALLESSEVVEAGLETTHVLGGLGSAIAAPFTLFEHGALQVAANCF